MWRNARQPGCFTPVPAENGLTDFDLFVSLTRQGRPRSSGAVDFNADLYLHEHDRPDGRAAAGAAAELVVAPDAAAVAAAGDGPAAVALAATFTVDPLARPGCEFWLRFLPGARLGASWPGTGNSWRTCSPG